MHDLLILFEYLTILMLPCVVALRTGLHDHTEGYMRDEAELEDLELRLGSIPR